MRKFSYKLVELREMAKQKANDLGISLEFEGNPENHSPDLIEYLSIDSRRIAHPASTLFIGVPGKNRSGDRFVVDAWRKGVRNFLVRDERFLAMGDNYLKTPDTVLALQCMAGAHRDLFDFPVIGITGSNGKTIVKEWLSTLLNGSFEIVKSPKSFNSQLGVPLSLSLMHEGAEIGIVEAGISHRGEMENLGRIIRANDVVLTHIGDAHAEGFSSREEKIAEKMRLVREETARIFVHRENGDGLAAARASGKQVLTVGKSREDDLRIIRPSATPEGWKFKVEAAKTRISMELKVGGEAALENATLAMLVAWSYGVSLETIASRLLQLRPISMRMEMISDNPEVTIINDAYNADVSSIHNAFASLETESNQPGRAVILSDLEHQGKGQDETQMKILEEAIARFGAENIFVVGPVFYGIARDLPGISAFPDVRDFLKDFRYEAFRRKIVLLKGARKFELEQVIPYLSRRAIASWFSINLNDLAHNFREFRSALEPKTKMVAMVKAFAYGSGSWEIAQALEAEGVDYLAVAYTSAGIDLRLRGIQAPIMVMNPDENSLDQLFVHRLEPAVFDQGFLEKVWRAGELAGAIEVPVHIKVDTGMRRLGFEADKSERLGKWLKDHPAILVKSVFSHLSAADDPIYDGHTRRQIEIYTEFFDGLCEWLDYRPDRHILNTAGILRFPEAQMEMVRLGIGLYGVAPVETTLDLHEVGSLHAIVSQVHAYPKGVPVGYGCSEVTGRPSRIATVPIGYADGIRRSLSNGKARFLVRGQRAPVFGRICMDMLMLDVTDIPGVVAGDEVVLLGRQGNDFISVHELADLCDTIPYEILTGISSRVRRLYVKE